MPERSEGSSGFRGSAPARRYPRRTQALPARAKSGQMGLVRLPFAAIDAHLIGPTRAPAATRDIPDPLPTLPPAADAVKRPRAKIVRHRRGEHSRLAHRAALSPIRPAGRRTLSRPAMEELDDVFWTIIPFGTGGRRGKMYPIGSTPSTIARSAKAPGSGRLRERRGPAGGHGWPARLRHRLRHPAPVAAFCRAVCRDHGRRPASKSTFSTAIAARRSCPSPCAITIELRHHGHGQPQSAQR